MDVDECGDRLDLEAMLGMVDEVSLAGLVSGVPFEDVKLCAHGKRRAPDEDARWIWYLRVICLGALPLIWSDVGGGALKGLLYFTVRASGEFHEAWCFQSARIY